MKTYRSNYIVPLFLIPSLLGQSAHDTKHPSELQNPRQLVVCFDEDFLKLHANDRKNISDISNDIIRRLNAGDESVVKIVDDLMEQVGIKGGEKKFLIYWMLKTSRFSINNEEKYFELMRRFLHQSAIEGSRNGIVEWVRGQLDRPLGMERAEVDECVRIVKSMGDDNAEARRTLLARLTLVYGSRSTGMVEEEAVGWIVNNKSVLLAYGYGGALLEAADYLVFGKPQGDKQPVRELLTPLIKRYDLGVALHSLYAMGRLMPEDAELDALCVKAIRDIMDVQSAELSMYYLSVKKWPGEGFLQRMNSSDDIVKAYADECVKQLSKEYGDNPSKDPRSSDKLRHFFKKASYRVPMPPGS